MITQANELPVPAASSICLFVLSQAVAMTAVAQPSEPPLDEGALEPIRVEAERIANLQPAASYPAIATALRYDPQVDLQSRGLAEGQADVTVRGGLFENTGFTLGAAAILDPQTGHYAVEIPVDPAMLSSPRVLTGMDHALRAFNASVATIEYGFVEIATGGSVIAGLGSDDLRYASARVSQAADRANGDRFGLTASASGSAGDGSLPNGDHDFKRFSAHAQYATAHGETNAIIGYQDKFFGWPGAYTGFASLPETDHIKQGLLLLDHRRDHGQGWWQLGASYRWLKDDYDFDRRTTESGTPGSFDHKTRSVTLGLAGEQRAGGLDWHFAAQLAADELVYSTDLTNGHFNSRSYLSFSLAPGHAWQLDNGNTLALRAGLRADLSNRDQDALMPLLSASLEMPSGDALNRLALDFTRTSQLPGYTALNSRPAGLFGGNPDLGREYANTLSLSAAHERGHWQVRGAVFHRRDDDLVDWTYFSGSPNARQANPVDIHVTGIEAFMSWHASQLDVFAGYTWMDKNENYGSALVDASFYALNYARHRLTLALQYRPLDTLEIRLDNEYRQQQKNALRGSDDSAYTASASIRWRPFSPATHVALVADNLTDNDFQEFPGTPAVGRQLSLGFGVDW